MPDKIMIPPGLGVSAQTFSTTMGVRNPWLGYQHPFNSKQKKSPGPLLVLATPETKFLGNACCGETPIRRTVGMQMTLGVTKGDKLS